MKLYVSSIKRGFDVLAACLLILLSSPVLALVALAILFEDGRPVLFRQRRVGRNNREFTIFKFRSMPVGVPNVPSASATSLKVTRVGQFIRRTNIDELPQLFNVFRGEMSVVGPRPALPVQRELLAMRTARGVDRLRPGMTGLAQVNAYDGMPESEKVDWEARYAASITLATDVAVLFRTIGYVMRRPPVY